MNYFVHQTPESSWISEKLSPPSAQGKDDSNKDKYFAEKLKI